MRQSILIWSHSVARKCQFISSENCNVPQPRSLASVTHRFQKLEELSKVHRRFCATCPFFGGVSHQLHQVLTIQIRMFHRDLVDDGCIVFDQSFAPAFELFSARYVR